MAVYVITTEEDLESAYSIRKKVFVEEQQVPLELEMDEYDKEAIHFLCTNELNEPIGTSRLRFIDSYGKLERICVLKPYRGQSYGKQIIKRMEAEITARGYKNAKLNAQAYASAFYEQLGYQIVSEPFYDANIVHVAMKKQL